jgi:hypothetical protein
VNVAATRGSKVEGMTKSAAKEYCKQKNLTSCALTNFKLLSQIKIKAINTNTDQSLLECSFLSII